MSWARLFDSKLCAALHFVRTDRHCDEDVGDSAQSDVSASCVGNAGGSSTRSPSVMRVVRELLEAVQHQAAEAHIGEVSPGVTTQPTCDIILGTLHSLQRRVRHLLDETQAAAKASQPRRNDPLSSRRQLSELEHWEEFYRRHWCEDGLARNCASDDPCASQGICVERESQSVNIAVADLTLNTATAKSNTEKSERIPKANPRIKHTKKKQSERITVKSLKKYGGIIRKKTGKQSTVPSPDTSSKRQRGDLDIPRQRSGQDVQEAVEPPVMKATITDANTKNLETKAQVKTKPKSVTKRQSQRIAANSTNKYQRKIRKRTGKQSTVSSATTRSKRRRRGDLNTSRHRTDQNVKEAVEDSVTKTTVVEVKTKKVETKRKPKPKRVTKRRSQRISNSTKYKSKLRR